MNIIVVILAVWAALVTLLWAIIHVGARSDPDKWDG